MTLSNKRKKFVDEYLKCWNQAEAARRAGYSHPTVMGTRLAKVSDISDEIRKRIEENSMSADEVLARIGDIARGDLGQFLDIGSMAFDLSLVKANELGITHLIKKVTQTTRYTKDEEEIHTIHIELHDSLAALQLLAKHHKLFVERHELTGKDGDPLYPGPAVDQSISKLADALGEVVPSQNGRSAHPVGATE